MSPHHAWFLIRVLILQGKAPKCGKGHRLALSSFSGQGYEGGYSCDICRGSSSEGHCGGTRERWFCENCSFDLCFQCVPRATADAGSFAVRGCSFAVRTTCYL
jgi:hypothetical protein